MLSRSSGSQSGSPSSIGSRWAPAVGDSNSEVRRNEALPQFGHSGTGSAAEDRLIGKPQARQTNDPCPAPLDPVRNASVVVRIPSPFLWQS
jgi:hypothetical protein